MMKADYMEGTLDTALALLGYGLRRVGRGLGLLAWWVLLMLANCIYAAAMWTLDLVRETDWAAFLALMVKMGGGVLLATVFLYLVMAYSWLLL